MDLKLKIKRNRQRYLKECGFHLGLKDFPKEAQQAIKDQMVI